MALAFVTAASPACGGGGGAHDASAGDAAAQADGDAGGCQVANASCTSGQQGFLLCTDYAYADVTTFETACASTNGTWVTTPCDRTGAVEGCRTVQATGCATAWYGDSMQVDQLCMGNGMELVGP